MKIQTVSLHNFRSIKDAKVSLGDYSILVGENNAGKTNVLTALRIFYEDDIKYEEDRDFPKFPTDGESWIELEFLTTQKEQMNLNESFKSIDNILKVRRYFKSDKYANGHHKNIYGYENGTLSNKLFTGAKNFSHSNFGRVIYIPDISMSNEALKLSGPSPFKTLVNFVFNNVLTQSPSFQSLNAKVHDLNNDFMKESSDDGISLNDLKDRINRELQSWGVEFGMRINQLQPQDIIKSLFSYYLEDKGLSKDVDINSLGQGIQRHLIYTLIKLSSEYVKKGKGDKDYLLPDTILLLFDEPEAFLHPSQQIQLNNDLNQLAKADGQQVLISTHSPTFVSKNIEDIRSILCVKRENAMTNIFQLSLDDVERLKNENYSFFKKFSEILKDESVDSSLKKKIKSLKLAEENFDTEKKLEEESLKYFMWLDAERTASFFAKHVIICEGATEKVAFEYLINSSLDDYVEKHVYILDSMGKFNIHRYMNLFGKLGITHSVLYDSDNNKDIQGIVNDFLNSMKNGYTKEICTFDSDFEQFLGIEPLSRKDLKPLNVLKNLKNSEISNEKMEELKEMFNKLCKF